MSKQNLNRREFIKRSAAGTATASLAINTATSFITNAQSSNANSRVNVGFIGVGARAHQLLEDIKLVPGVEVVAICDAYKGRLERAMERTGGRAKIYPNHAELLAAKDVDAVFVVTPDHLHRRHVVDAVNAGKDVYCEKPLTYTIEDGLEIIAATNKTGRIVQVGSQGVSSAAQKKAREIIASGKLGQITMVRATNHRNTAGGAWIYPIPPDASPETVNWEMFRGQTSQKSYSPERFFRWRCYEEYSGGIATDLYVHLITTIHYIMNAQAPEIVMAMGQLYRWKDSRDVPDTLNGILQYPEGFVVNLSATFNNEAVNERGFQIMGTEGTLEIGGKGVTFTPSRSNDDNGWIVDSWPSKLQKAYYNDPKIIAAERPNRQPQKVVAGQERWEEIGYGDAVPHIQNFVSAIKTRQQPYENAVVGHRAAAVAHMVNLSAKHKKPVVWDRDKDKVKAD
ncbi:MAG: Gfo/Idh/MocA family oxidoreductase [Blastocatellia bacterium]